jgi:hypothetical protein
MFHVEHLACFFQCHSPVYSLGTAPLFRTRSATICPVNVSNDKVAAGGRIEPMDPHIMIFLLEV